MRVAAEHAMQLVPADPPTAGRAHALAALASSRMHDGRFVAAAELAREAASIAASLDAPSIEAWARAVHGECLGQLGQDDAALAEADRAVRARRPLG